MTANRIQSLVDDAWPSISRWVGDILAEPEKRPVNRLIPSRTMSDAEWKAIPLAEYADLWSPSQDPLVANRFYRWSHRLNVDEKELLLGSTHPDFKSRVEGFTRASTAIQLRTALIFACSRAHREDVGPAGNHEALVQKLRQLRDDKIPEERPLVAAILRDTDVKDEVGAITFVEVEAGDMPDDIHAVLIPHGIPSVQIERATDLTLAWDPPTVTMQRLQDPRRTTAVIDLVLEERFRYLSTAPDVIDALGV